jgi:L-lactate dehydrogenase complex protein LldG
MKTTSDARSEILSRIDAAIGTASADPSAEWEKLSRDYIRQDSLAGAQLLQLFEHRLIDYGARVFHSGSENIRQAIENILAERGAKQLLVPGGFPGDWLPTSATFTPDDDLSYERIDGFDGVITTATAAIAATGSIVLQHGAGQGRRALSLIPDYHLCIVSQTQVVETVPAAFRRLDPTQPVTFISGPSATADIEMTRIKGVHGPRFLDVILI